MHGKACRYFRAISIRAKWGLTTFILRQSEGGAAYPAGFEPRSHGSGFHSLSYITKVRNRNVSEAVYCRVWHFKPSSYCTGVLISP